MALRLLSSNFDLLWSDSLRSIHFAGADNEFEEPEALLLQDRFYSLRLVVH